MHCDWSANFILGGVQIVTCMSSEYLHIIGLSSNGWCLLRQRMHFIALKILMSNLQDLLSIIGQQMRFMPHLGLQISESQRGSVDLCLPRFSAIHLLLRAYYTACTVESEPCYQHVPTCTRMVSSTNSSSAIAMRRTSVRVPRRACFFDLISYFGPPHQCCRLFV